MKIAGWLCSLALLGCSAHEPPAPARPQPTQVPKAAPAPKPDDPAQYAAGMAAYEAKDFARCASTLEQLASADALYNAACCHALGGQREQAFATLDKVLAIGFRDAAGIQKDADLASLHDDPRWEKVVSGVVANGAKFEASLKEPALRKELLAMRDVDQAARAELIADMQNKALIEKMRAVDRSSVVRMKEIIAKYGWPGKSLVGTDGASAAWLLVQHADHDIAFQKQCLELLERAVKAGEARGVDHAYLYDRVAVAENRPQRFGTQFKDARPQPIEDEAHIDERRAAIGLPTMAEYAKEMQKVYGTPFYPTTK